MKQQAKEELKILEAQHPNRFQYLKLELKAFIHLLDEAEEEESFKQKQQQHFHHLSILTQESSSRKMKRQKRKRERTGEMDRRKDEGYLERRSAEGINAAIQKAEACLHKIQTLKSFFCSSSH